MKSSRVSTTAKRNAALEQAILADLDDPRAWLVYGDWLQAAGDPRGELVTVQTTLEMSQKEKNLNLERRVDAILEKYAAELIGPLRRHPRTLDGKNQTAFTFKRGFIHSLCISYLAQVHQATANAPRVEMPAYFSEVLAHPSSRLVQEIVLAHFDDGVWDEKRSSSQIYEKLVHRLAAAKPRALRRLVIGHFAFPDETRISAAHVGRLEPIWKACPGLEVLRVLGAQIDFGVIDAPNLRALSVRTSGLSKDAVRQLANASFPRLERLTIWFGGTRGGAGGTLEDIQPILDARNLPKLEHLELMNAEFTDDIARAIGDSIVIAQLGTLNLSMGTMTDAGAAHLRLAAKAVQHLKVLDLSENFLSSMLGLERLAASVVFGKQKSEAAFAFARRVSIEE